MRRVSFTRKIRHFHLQKSAHRAQLDARRIYTGRYAPGRYCHQYDCLCHCASLSDLRLAVIHYYVGYKNNGAAFSCPVWLGLLEEALVNMQYILTFWVK